MNKKTKVSLQRLTYFLCAALIISIFVNPELRYILLLLLACIQFVLVVTKVKDK